MKKTKAAKSVNLDLIDGLVSTKIEPTKLIKYDGMGIAVFDDIFTGKFVEDMALKVLSQEFMLRPSFDNELSAPMTRKFIKSIPALSFAASQVIKDIYPKISTKRARQHLSHGYAAAFRFGDSTQLHQDVQCRDCMTLLYYSNPKWNGLWGGETVFYDSRLDAFAAITPAPGRLIMFNAALPHRAGVPNKACPSFRYGVSVFFRCRKQAKT